jgi:HK97 family phage portal protein
MAFRDAVASFFGMTLVDRPPERALSSTVEDTIDVLINRRTYPNAGAWRVPTVAEAMTVPAIFRAVTLISSTTGMLSMQGFRNGNPMDEPPVLIVRPDPDEAPGVFYETTAANMAKYGEFVWWIASRDSDGNPQALVNVPLNELRVDDNPDNRRRPKYQWGNIKGTRWTPANRSGEFVHRKYAGTEPFALRGEGPLQRTKAAVSIAVEAQTWAANFYGDGGKPRDIIKHSGQLDPTLRDEYGNPDEESGLSEADRLKAQYIARDNNTPIVIDSLIEDITHPSIDVGGAQMLEARIHQRGDAALSFGLPGHFLEYVQSGTSLTYTTLETAFGELIKVCLQPLYLEPIEQAISDLLPRSTIARFNIKGFNRADIKTRYEVHGIAIEKGIYGPEYAQREEGILPGDVEYAPVPFQPPAAVPTSIPRAISIEPRCPSCNKLVARALGAGSELDCPRCKAEVKVA